MTVLLHGIGNGGDNANPTSKGNFTPLHPQRTLTIELYDANNTLVKSVSGTVSFNSTNGNFTGILDGGSTVNTGSYLVKVKGIPYLPALPQHPARTPARLSDRVLRGHRHCPCRQDSSTYSR